MSRGLVVTYNKTHIRTIKEHMDMQLYVYGVIINRVMAINVLTLSAFSDLENFNCLFSNGRDSCGM